MHGRFVYECFSLTRSLFVSVRCRIVCVYMCACLSVYMCVTSHTLTLSNSSSGDPSSGCGPCSSCPSGTGWGLGLFHCTPESARTSSGRSSGMLAAVVMHLYTRPLPPLATCSIHTYKDSKPVHTRYTDRETLECRAGHCACCPSPFLLATCRPASCVCCVVLPCVCLHVAEPDL